MKDCNATCNATCSTIAEVGCFFECIVKTCYVLFDLSSFYGKYIEKPSKELVRNLQSNSY